MTVTTEDQLAFIVDELQQQRAQREQMQELLTTLAPVARQGMQMATDELTDLDLQSADLVRTLRLLAANLPQIEALLAQLGPLSDLAAQLTALSGPAMAKLTETLEAADEKGYFGFARQATAIADRVVTEYSEDDVKALGDNVVTILDAVKEMTQPEVMDLVQRSAVQMHEPMEEPPSMFALLKSMRDPQTRRGLARVMAMLHTVGEDHPQGRK